MEQEKQRLNTKKRPMIGDPEYLDMLNEKIEYIHNAGKHTPPEFVRSPWQEEKLRATLIGITAEHWGLSEVRHYWGHSGGECSLPKTRVVLESLIEEIDRLNKNRGNQ